MPAPCVRLNRWCAMPRYKCIVEYDGTPFCGWQRQADRLSVQQVMQEAVFGFSGENVEVCAAGRTDAGVHAFHQVVHFCIEKDLGADRLQGAINHHMRPHPVAAVAVAKVDDDFHARFSATSRSYCYHIVNRRAPLAIDTKRAWHVAVKLDIAAMQKAVPLLLGTHDFTSLRSTECQAKSPVKTLDYVEIVVNGEQIEIRVEARSFLHHMVRNIVGTLFYVGTGNWSPGYIKDVIEAKDRTRAGMTAPAHGLYLTHVGYNGDRLYGTQG